MNKEIVFGPPGCGKTTYLLNKVDEYLQSGIPADKIALISFTTKAANEAKTRAIERFKLKSKDLLWFRTLHSLAFNWMKMSTTDVMKREHYSELCESLGLEYSGYIVLDEGITLPGSMEGDRMLFDEGLSRVRLITPHEQYQLANPEYNYDEFIRFCKALNEYKDSNALYDFNDMLKMFVDTQFMPEFDVLIIDESQDLSKLQWAAVQRLMDNSKVVHIAADDDQSIFQWAGADPDTLLSLEGTKTILTQSYRLPASVHHLATGIIKRVSHRQPKEFLPRSEMGSVSFVNSIEEIPFEEGNFLVLARNLYLLDEMVSLCETEGFPYDHKKSPMRTDIVRAIVAYESVGKGNPISSEQVKLIRKYHPNYRGEYTGLWHQVFDRMGTDLKDYFIAVLRRKESLIKEPRIRLSTIHGAKGGEADNVVVFSDMSFKSYQEMLDNPDSELRVFYVAVTRTRQNLYIVEPKTQNAFDLW